MSEFENEETMVEETVAAVDAAEVVEETAAEAAPAPEVEAAPTPEVEAAPERSLDEDLMAKIKKAEHLLFRRRMAVERAAEEKAAQVNQLARAIKLLELKPKMEQKEMSDLLGMRLRELDALLADAEKCDLVGRIEPEEPDMRKVVVFASEDALEHVGDITKKTEPLVPGLSNEEIEELFAHLDKVINPLAAMGLDEDRGPRGGRDRDDRGPRGGFGGRGGDRGGRGGFGGRDRDRDDRGPRGGFGGRGRDDRRDGDRSHGKYGSPRMGFGGRDDRDRGGRGGYGGGRGGFGGRDDRGGRGGFGGRGRDDRDGRRW